MSEGGQGEQSSQAPTTTRAAGQRARRIAGTIARVLGLVVLALATLYVGAYFALGSTPGRAALRGLVGDALRGTDPNATIADVQWGPAPGRVWASGIVVSTPTGILEIELVQARVGVPSMAPEVVEAWIGKARVTLPPPERTPPIVAGADPATAQKKPRANVPRIPHVRVHVAELDLTTPDFVFHARDVSVRGSLGEANEVEVQTGVCHAAWMAGRRVSGWDGCRLAGRMQGRHLDDLRLVLMRDGHAVVHIEASAVLPGKGGPASGDGPESTATRGTATADLDLGPWDATVLAGDQLPLGLVAQGLVVELDGERVTGSLGAIHAPLFVNGPFTGELVSFEVPRFAGEPGLFGAIPRVTLTVRGLVAAHAHALDWAVDGVAAPAMTLDLEKKLVGEIPGVTIDRWSFPGGSVGPVASDVDLAIGISGGNVQGLVATPDGVFAAQGRLKKSPITKRSSFVASAAFDGLRGPLRDLFLHDLEDTERALLTGGNTSMPPLLGSFELAVELERASRFSPWELELEWDATELIGHTRIVWDGDVWVEEAAAPAPPGDDEDDGDDGDGGDTDDAETAEP